MTFVPARPPVVVDASVAVELLGEGSRAMEGVWLGWAEAGRIRLVPAHFWAETANGLLRGRQMPAEEVLVRVDRVRSTGIDTADRGPMGLADAIGLADRHRLTVYDALYLQLALDVDGSIATLDRALARAAQAEDVPLEPLEALAPLEPPG